MQRRTYISEGRWVISNLIHYLCVSRIARALYCTGFLCGHICMLTWRDWAWKILCVVGIPRRVSTDWHKPRAFSWANLLTLVMFRTSASERLGMTAKVTRNGRSFIRIPSRVLARKWQKLVVREGSEIEARSSSCRFAGEELRGIQMFFFSSCLLSRTL